MAEPLAVDRSEVIAVYGDYKFLQSYIPEDEELNMIYFRETDENPSILIAQARGIIDKTLWLCADLALVTTKLYRWLSGNLPSDKGVTEEAKRTFYPQFVASLVALYNFVFGAALHDAENRGLLYSEDKALDSAIARFAVLIHKSNGSLDDTEVKGIIDEAADIFLKISDIKSKKLDKVTVDAEVAPVRISVDYFGKLMGVYKDGIVEKLYTILGKYPFLREMIVHASDENNYDIVKRWVCQNIVWAWGGIFDDYVKDVTGKGSNDTTKDNVDGLIQYVGDANSVAYAETAKDMTLWIQNLRDVTVNAISAINDNYLVGIEGLAAATAQAPTGVISNAYLIALMAAVHPEIQVAVMRNNPATIEPLKASRNAFVNRWSALDIMRRDDTTHRILGFCFPHGAVPHPLKISGTPSLESITNEEHQCVGNETKLQYAAKLFSPGDDLGLYYPRGKVEAPPAAAAAAAPAELPAVAAPVPSPSPFKREEEVHPITMLEIEGAQSSIRQLQTHIDVLTQEKDAAAAATVTATAELEQVRQKLTVVQDRLSKSEAEAAEIIQRLTNEKVAETQRAKAAEDGRAQIYLQLQEANKSERLASADSEEKQKLLNTAITERERLEEVVRDLRTQVESRDKNLKALSDAMGAQEMERSIVSSEAETQQKRADDLQSELAGMRAELKTLQQAQGAEGGELRTKLAAVERENASLAERIRQNTDDIRTKAAQILELEKEIQTQKMRVDESSRQMRDNEQKASRIIEGLRGENKTLTKEIRKIQERNGALTTELDRASTALRAAQADLERLHSVPVVQIMPAAAAAAAASPGARRRKGPERLEMFAMDPGYCQGDDVADECFDGSKFDVKCGTADQVQKKKCDYRTISPQIDPRKGPDVYGALDLGSKIRLHLLAAKDLFVKGRAAVLRNSTIVLDKTLVPLHSIYGAQVINDVKVARNPLVLPNARIVILAVNNGGNGSIIRAPFEILYGGTDLDTIRAKFPVIRVENGMSVLNLTIQGAQLPLGRDSIRVDDLLVHDAYTGHERRWSPMLSGYASGMPPSSANRDALLQGERDVAEAIMHLYNAAHVLMVDAVKQNANLGYGFAKIPDADFNAAAAAAILFPRKPKPSGGAPTTTNELGLIVHVPRFGKDRDASWGSRVAAAGAWVLQNYVEEPKGQLPSDDTKFENTGFVRLKMALKLREKFYE